MSASSSSPANRALRAFLEQCCDRPPLTADIASNAVLEWFGRTVRGHSRIQQFLRHTVHRQYEQSFAGTAARALPSGQGIESKPTHEQTRTTPPENLATVIVMATPSVNDANGPGPSTSTMPTNELSPEGSQLHVPRSDASTPVDRIRYGPPPTPGAPAQGRTFRRFPSGEESAKEIVPESTTEPIATCNDDSDEFSGIDELPPVGAQTSRRPPPPTPRRRKPSKAPSTAPVAAQRFAEDATGEDHELLSIQACNVDAAADEHQTLSVHYTELQYLEAVGLVRQHSAGGGRLASTASPRLPPPNATDDDWERPVRLRISWRWRTQSDGAVSAQFALIVYEQQTVNVRMRRNLMGDFAQTIVTDASANVDAELQTQQQQSDQLQEDVTVVPQTPQTPAATGDLLRPVPATDSPRPANRTNVAKRAAKTAVKRDLSFMLSGEKSRPSSTSSSSSLSSFKTSLKRLRF